MSDSDPGWVLAVPFMVATPLRLYGETSETLDSLTIRVLPAGSDYNKLLFEGLHSAEEARQQFEVLRTGTLAAGLYIGSGVRISREVIVLDENTAPPNDSGLAIAYPRGRDLSRLIIRPGEVEFQAEKVLPRFMKGLRVGLTAQRPGQAMQDKKVRLASLVYADSHFEASPQAKFLGFIGVLEVLKGQEPRSVAARELIDRWISEIGSAEKTEAQSLRDSLKHLKSTSIGQGIRSVVRRHLGEADAREASNLYAQRSQLVHNGELKSPNDIAAVARQAAALVARLLAQILSVGRR
jgi:hypothetical protein